MTVRFRSIFVGASALLLAGLATAHDDDPKLRSQTLPRSSAGYRNVWVANPAGAGGSIEMGGGSFPADQVTLLAWLPLSSFGNTAGGNDCWGYTSPSGREYAIFCHWDGTSYVEITDPTNPVIVATTPTAQSGGNNLWRDAKTYLNYCYIVTENNGGIQVVDLSNIDSGVATLVGTTTGPGTGNTHNVAIDETSGFLYRSGGGNEGLRIYSLANPSNPTYVGSWVTKYVHDVQVVTYESGPYAGKQVAFCFSGFDGGWTQPGVDILDVTNKSNIQVMSSFQYPQPAYSHQGWLSPDKQYLYIGDELDEDDFNVDTRTYIYDVSNLNSPSYGGVLDSGNAAIGHNMYSSGNLLYQANYRSGLRIYDITNPTNPSEVGFFDTWPSDDNSDFNGLWSCYPYFPSGIVIGSDRDSGLFVWWQGDPEITFAFPQGLPDFIDPAGETLPVTLSQISPGVYVPGTATLHVDAGNGWQSYPMTDLGGGNFEAGFPVSACGASIAYYFSAQGTSGITWADPAGAPMETHQATSGLGVTPVVADDMEVDAGWTVGASGDDATTGIWVRANPLGTAAQPEDDHTPGAGVNCWFTGQGSPGGSDGENDVDGGRTTLLSPIYDLSAMSAPVVSYWRWYSNSTGGAGNADVFEVSISNNGGSSWQTVEIVGPSGAETDGGWYFHQFLVADVIQPSANIQLRFVASDEGQGSIVEAAVDDLAVEDVDCGGGGCGTTSYCVTSPNSAGNGALMSSSGSPSISQNAFFLEVTGATPNQNGLFYYGPNQIQVPFGEGFRCVGGGSIGTFRLNPAQITDTFGDATRQLDFTQPPASMGPGAMQPGDVWNFQFWYRDPAGGGSGFNFSDGLSVSVCP